MRPITETRDVQNRVNRLLAGGRLGVCSAC